ncbi:hypothetical protein L202_06719 [Cryptococcus amylolentus CBS 6039]|uniref:TauD/TfdA-like domain-containing protein n=1 Tax=Cryptococcus amylolentus CBS 6039 TaxID=1295533 RepID=A0A1E3HGX6_9TREE|nr:hypothetical protein L202_06719 [Cryptococcus amylolentus CBS 6039]ODN75600.1 hypothetical protein L202_06719 [Cryptococcus amylolentus CBS 6039]
MTAVQAPVSALTDSFKDLGVNAPLVGYTVTADSQKRAKIYETSYEPSLDWWTADQKAYVKPENDPLPEGFPEQDHAASDWDGRVLINQPEKFLYKFTPEDISLINKAHDHFISLNLHKDLISPSTFPIPEDSTLYKALRHAEHEINHGLGLRVLRGLPVDEWTREKQLAVFAGVSSYISEKRIKQGLQNVVHLRDITNLDVDKRPAITVKGQTSGNQVYHNDGSAGIIGLITLGVAETGGLSQLASVAHTYNELARTRRDIVRELAKGDWVNKQYPDGKPLFFAHNNRVISSYSRRPFFGFYEADPDVPPLPTEKHLALDAVHFTAEKFGLDLNLEKGDLEYFNNLTVFHARTSSSDSPTNARHLVRIWLQNPSFYASSIPPQLAALYDRINEGEAHGWPLEAWDSVDPYHEFKDAERKTQEGEGERKEGKKEGPGEPIIAGNAVY